MQTCAAWLCGQPRLLDRPTARVRPAAAGARGDVVGAEADGYSSDDSLYTGFGARRNSFTFSQGEDFYNEAEI